MLIRAAQTQTVVTITSPQASTTITMAIPHINIPMECVHTILMITWIINTASQVVIRTILQGHSGKGVGEQVYTHIDMERLKEEINQL